MRLLLWLGVWLASATAVSSAERASSLPDGTLLFLENCNSVVEYTTRGEIAHVALVFHEGGDAWVYEATPGNVRRVIVGDYFAELARLNQRRDEDDLIRVLALKPLRPYSTDEAARMRLYLNQQIGRRYSVKNYVRGKPYDGIHCAELASTTLNHSGRYAFEACHKLHPQALYAAVLPTHAAPLPLSIPRLVIQEPWYVNLQRRWITMFAWCRWSSREAWLFFW